MSSPRIIAYAFNASLYCPCCTREALAGGNLEHTGNLECKIDEHNLPMDLVDRHGDPVSPMFSTDEVPDNGVECHHCELVIEPPPMVECHFETGLTIRMRRDAAREISCPGRDASEYCEYWLSERDSGIDWDKLTDAEIREAVASAGAWTDEDLEDDHENKLRLLWLAAGYAHADGQF